MDEMTGRTVHADDVAWIEILSRHGDVVARHRCATGEIRIGRAYDNDIVLDDPYVAVSHLRVFCDERGDWIAEDLGSVNGMFAERDKRRQQRIVLDGNRTIRIGHTQLRLRRASHQVPRERVAQTSARVLSIVLALGAVVLGIEALDLWLQETAEPKLSRYLVPLLVLPLVVAGWTAAWAIVTRIFSGQSRFERHLLIATTAVLATSLYNDLGELLAFAASWSAVTTYGYIGAWCVLAVTCFFHAREVGRSHLRLKAGLVGMLMVIGIAIQSVGQFDGRDVQPPREVRFLPPVLRIAPLQTDAAFFADIDRLKSKLDRLKAPAAGFDEMFSLDGDD